MSTLAKANPAIYPELRQRALQLRRSDLPPEALRAVVMDWRTGNGVATVLAAADGTASIYLSSGGGFIGGSQANSKLREAALHAVRLASQSLPTGSAADSEAPLPPAGQVFFHFVTGQGTFCTAAAEQQLRDGTSPLTSLGAAMQQIVTLYRMGQKTHEPAPQPPPAQRSRPQYPPDSPRTKAIPAFWGKQDGFGRGVQAACGVVLLVAAMALFYYTATQTYSYRGGADVAAIGCLVLGVRCLWYAITGKDNVNLDEF